MYIFLRILHLSSNRRERNSAHLFPVMTPARKLTHNTKFECFLDAKRHEFQERHNYLSPWAREMPKSDPERHEFRERHNYSSPWAREMPKSDPERHEFWEHHHSLLPWARESPKSYPERHEFQETALINPSKKCQQIRKVFFFPEFRTIIEMHSLTPSTLTNQSLLGTPSSTFSLIADQL